VKGIYGVFVLDKEWVIIKAEPENINIKVRFDLSELIYEKSEKLNEKELYGVCKALNENRIPEFDSQECMALILEKYTTQTLIYDINQDI